MEHQLYSNELRADSNGNSTLMASSSNMPKDNLFSDLSATDPENPQNWPLYKKVYASSVATAFAFVVAFGLTAYTAGISGVIETFDVSMTNAILGMSLYLFGIVFAPIYTPHLSERFGRVPVYLVSIPIFMLFILGASRSQSFAALAASRFFAGFFGGPSLVLIEGTYADVWAARITGTYYAALILAPYIGTAVGPLVGGFVFAARGWRWTQYVTIIVAAAVWLYGVGVPETYAREIVRRRARRYGQPHNLPLALSGVTIREMVQTTVIDPVKQIFEPIVIISTIYLGYNFGVLFQFFISVPAVLSGVYSFTIQQVGIAFNAAIVGSALAFLTAAILDRIGLVIAARTEKAPIEYRMLPALWGSVALPASLFWIGYTAKPSISFFSPVFGTSLYVWGSMSIVISFVSYLFDAFRPAGTLSALTLAASFRLLLAGVFPLFIIQMINNLTGKWAMATFGFIAIALAPAPWIIYFFGAKLRARSKYSIVDVTTEDMTMTEAHIPA